MLPPRAARMPKACKNQSLELPPARGNSISAQSGDRLSTAEQRNTLKADPGSKEAQGAASLQVSSVTLAKKGPGALAT